jgi:hypothetical protein
MRKTLIIAIVMFGALSACVTRAEDAAQYCNPPIGTRLVYDDRVYTVAAVDGFTQTMHAELRHRDSEIIGMVLYRNVSEPWRFTRSGPDGFRSFWPAKRGNTLDYSIKNHSSQDIDGSVTIAGNENIELPFGTYKTWKITNAQAVDNGGRSIDTNWYSPELCASAQIAITGGVSKLLKILKPSDPDYARPIIYKNRHTYWGDTDQPVS